MINCINLAFDNHTCCVDPTLDLFQDFFHNEGFCGSSAKNAAHLKLNDANHWQNAFDGRALEELSVFHRSVVVRVLGANRA